MFNQMKRQFRPALLLFLALSVLTGAAYPLIFTAVAETLFPRQAKGSLILRDGQAIGSALIGQHFREAGHFWGRPSATAGHPYNAAASSGSNLGPTNPAQLEQMRSRIEEMRQAHGDAPVPVELVTASGSGLDPHISPAAAHYQMARVAASAGLEVDTVRKLVDSFTQPRQFGILGEPRVNVLLLNLALDELATRAAPGTAAHARP